MNRCIRKRIGLTLAVVALLTSTVLTTACGGRRHVAVQLDATFATAVFAASDAAMKACQDGTFTPAQCTVGGSVNKSAQQALVDVKAVTRALIDNPKATAVPKNLPDLLTALTRLQTLVGDLAPAVPLKPDLTGKVAAALAQAIKVIQSFTGGA